MTHTPTPYAKYTHYHDVWFDTDIRGVTTNLSEYPVEQRLRCSDPTCDPGLKDRVAALRDDAKRTVELGGVIDALWVIHRLSALLETPKGGT